MKLKNRGNGVGRVLFGTPVVRYEKNVPAIAIQKTCSSSHLSWCAANFSLQLSESESDLKEYKALRSKDAIDDPSSALQDRVQFLGKVG